MTTTDHQAADAEDGYFAPLGTGNHAPDPDVYGYPTDEAAAAEAADEAVADGATIEQAREVYARTLAAPDDEAVDSALVYIAARATALMQARLGADRSGTVSGLRELASLVDEALAAGAGPAEAAPGAVAEVGGAILEAALAGNTGVPIGTVLGLGAHRFTFSPDFAEDSAPWHFAGGGDQHHPDAMPSWSSSADLVGAGAEVVSVPVPIGQLAARAVTVVRAPAAAPQPVAETPAVDSPAGQLLHAARVAAVLIERLGDRIYRPNVRHNEIGAITGGGRYDDPWAGDLRYLANLRECVSILGATVTARITATGGLTVAATCVIDGVDVRIAAPLDPGSPAEPVARAWLAELGVEVQS